MRGRHKEWRWWTESGMYVCIYEIIYILIYVNFVSFIFFIHITLKDDHPSASVEKIDIGDEWDNI